MEKGLFDINKTNEDFYKEAVSILGKYDTDICDAISSFVAAIFDIDREEIFKHNTSRRYTIPRWLCWCALSELTCKSYSEIGRLFDKQGEGFTNSGVARGIISVREIIDRDPVVRSKWQMVKKFLKANENNVPSEKRITIVVPIGMKHRIEIKEADI